MTKLVFIHVPRTNGNTVIFSYRNHIIRYTHDSAKQVKMRLTHKWDDHWKFGFVRNPWDRIVSLWYRIHMDRHTTLKDDLDWQREDFHTWLNAGPKDPNYEKPERGPKKGWSKNSLDKLWHQKSNQFLYDMNPGKMFLDDAGLLMLDRVFKFEALPAAHKEIRERIGGIPPFNLPTRKQAPRTYKTHDLIVDPLDIEIIENFSEWEVKRFNYRFSNARR